MSKFYETHSFLYTHNTEYDEYGYDIGDYKVLDKGKVKDYILQLEKEYKSLVNEGV